MSDNRNLWTLNISENDFVDSLDSVIHFSGIKIVNKCLIEADRDFLKLVGQQIREFSDELIDKEHRLHIVKTVNKTRRIIENIYTWLKEHVPFEEGITYSVENILPMIDILIADKQLKIPLFDVRFLPRSNFGLCLQSNCAENKKAEKQFHDLILYPGLDRKSVV